MKLTIQNLSKTYANGVQALKNVNLTIGKGMFGLLGQNGAGKSTLMRTLATLQDADKGEVFLGDTDVFKEPGKIRQTLGYLPQEFGVYDSMSAEEMLDYIALIKGVSKRAERKALVEYLLDRVNLYAVRKKSLNSYSGGMKQRFGIAQALVGKPELIIVDEPTAGLDPEERTRFYNILSELGEEAIVILSTHIVEDVTSLCSDMAIIGGGEVLVHDTPQKIIKAVEGKLWVKEVDRSGLSACKEMFPVIAVHIKQGKTRIHAFSDTAPDASFEPKLPDMEDAYFAVIGGCANLSKTPLNA
ncbi:ABC transporter ATP-binding protein [Dethiosulfatarculus sandiegensis]|uniref:Multidrug ABC transporter ATPase n=1 Tax=Dethiosulfatarculus sandiegensis TaxID=1429043 RepID=A0A0D2G7N7_9BACT|nr:ABC transporter ATP-binding protein [Dethiosulfatarculus sandiegensis]KIX10952.1 multidrug ABC transporter ATPase [Dethiosulfatarculus sandiegensis]